MRAPSTNLLASSAVLIAAALWGLYWIPVRYFESVGMDGSLAVAALNFPAAIVAAIWMCFTLDAQKGYFRQIMLIGLISGLAMAFYGVSIIYTSVVRATLLFYLMPIWATLIGLYWLGEPANMRRWIAIFLGVSGMILLIYGSRSGALNLGDLLAFLSGWLWAVSTALLKRTGQIPIAGMLTWQFASTTVGALILGLFFNPNLFADVQPDQMAVTITLIASLLGVLPAIALIFWASQILFPGRVGLLLMAEVIVAIISATILLPEEFLSSLEWVAVVAIISAAIIEIAPDKRKETLHGK